jgi:hypothetical protein
VVPAGVSLEPRSVHMFEHETAATFAGRHTAGSEQQLMQLRRHRFATEE